MIPIGGNRDWQQPRLAEPQLTAVPQSVARRAFCFCPAIHLEHCTCVSLKKHKEVPDNVGQ
ncbi:hypothetical protein [Lancefieldella rimae]|uniref:hypothetical protein n=1 Tax=Lancefieldella rimae TaxID=1383 RepID=UPI0028809388|nr:hypothetical protein [Lancefieldella rimae]